MLLTSVIPETSLPLTLIAEALEPSVNQHHSYPQQL